MITHAEAQALLSERLDNPLDPYIDDVLEAHLASCEECRAFANSSAYLASSLRAMPFMPASNIVRQNVWQAIESQNTWRNRVTAAMTGQTAAIISTAAIALIVIAFASVAILRLVDSDNGGEDPEARLAAGTQENVALATETTESVETVIATEAAQPTSTSTPETPAQLLQPTESGAVSDPATEAPDPTATTAPTEVLAAEPTPTTPPEEMETPTVPPTLVPTTQPVLSAAPTEDTPTDLTGDLGPASSDPDDSATDESTTFNPASLIGTIVSSGETPLPSPTSAPPTETQVPATETPAPTPTSVPPTETPVVPTQTPVSSPTLIPPTETSVPPTATPEPSPTLAPPTDAPSPSPTSVSPTPTPPSPTEAEESTSPPIEPIDGEVVDGETPSPPPTEADTALDGQASAENDDQQIIGPAGPQGESGVGGATSPPDDDSEEGDGDEEDTQFIEPIGGDNGGDDEDIDLLEIIEGGGTPAPAEEIQDQETTGEVIAPALIDEIEDQQAIDGDTTTPALDDEPEDEESMQESGSFPLSEAPFFSNGQPWGSLNDRLGFQDGSVIFSGNPDGFSLGRDDVELQTVGTENGQGIAICSDGACVAATTDSADGPHTDEPIGWVDGRLIYQRIGNGNGQPVEIRAVEWNGTPLSDQQLGAIDGPVSPLGTAYPVETGTLIPTSSSWLLITGESAQEIDGNPYGDIRLVRTNFQADVITYVAGGELIIASLSSPGSAITTLPFNGVDYDLSPDTQSVAISTGSGIEIYSLDGSLIGTSDSSVETGSLLWRSSGIVFIDQTNNVIRLLDPAEL